MTTIPRANLAQLIEAADFAPSVHGTRPWQWEVLPDGVQLVAVQEQRLLVADREGRDLVISCGASLHSLEVAAAAAGWRARARRFPDLDRPAVVARVRFEPHHVTTVDRERAAALELRRTDRRAGPAWPVPGPRLEQAWKLAAQHGVLAVPFTSEDERDALLGLMAAAARVQERDLAYRIELSLWGQARRPVDLSDTDAAWVVLATSSDDPLSWLRVGEALQAMWLWAVQQRLSLLPHSQVLEVAPLRRRLQEELLDDTACPQLVVRVGWPPVDREPAATGQATPRTRPATRQGA